MRECYYTIDGNRLSKLFLMWVESVHGPGGGMLGNVPSFGESSWVLLGVRMRVGEPFSRT